MVWKKCDSCKQVRYFTQEYALDCNSCEYTYQYMVQNMNPLTRLCLQCIKPTYLEELIHGLCRICYKKGLL